MAEYADIIKPLKLYQALHASAGRADIQQSDIDILAGLVLEVADIAGPLYERIQLTFRQYTEHGIVHSRNVVYLMGKFIPPRTLDSLNGLEIAILLLAGLLHDSGMVISDQEREHHAQSEAFRHFVASCADRAAAIAQARAARNEPRAAAIHDALLAEYFRRIHPERARGFVQTHVNGKLTLLFREQDITAHVLRVCESHSWGVIESSDPRNPQKSVCKLRTNRPVLGVPVNEQYLACCLRLADMMDFDRSRTPIGVFQTVVFTETKSWEEWNKHLQITNWSIDDRNVAFGAECTHPAYYVAVHEFLDWVDSELRDCRQLVVKQTPKDIAKRYLLTLPTTVDRSQIEMADKQYLAGAFRFQLEYERIMQLLMDKSLYPDPNLFLRELLQNSMDACRNREAIAKASGQLHLYDPKIVVWDHSDDPSDPRIVFQDNGVGMSRKIVEEYFMRVGRSYYRSPEFDAERQRLKEAEVELDACSQFGIGILSCFMVADRFDVETYRIGHEPLVITIEGPTKYFLIRILAPPEPCDFAPPPASDYSDGPPDYAGTRVTVHLRPGIAFDAVQVLDRFAANVDYDVRVYAPGADEPREIAKFGWEKEITIADPGAAVIVRARVSSVEWANIGDEVSQRIRSALENVLVPSRIPFEKYDFSHHLRGISAFWFLRGPDGRPSLWNGHLALSKSVLHCVGLPAVFTRIKAAGGLVDRRRRQEFATALRDGWVQRGEADPWDEFETMCVRVWASMADDERQAMLAWLETDAGGKQDRFVPWFERRDVAEELLRGGMAWAWSSVEVDAFVEFGVVPPSIALRGMHLPGGLIDLDLVAGNSNKVALWNSWGYARVDVRGPTAPTPSVSRLFVGLPEAEKLAIPFARAALRHALALAEEGGEEGGWWRWFEDFLVSITDLHFWPEAVWLELETLEQRRIYLGPGGFMSRQQVIDWFGRWAPVNTAGLLVSNWEHSPAALLSSMLLTFKPLRKQGEVWEADMEGSIPPREKTLKAAVDKLVQTLRGS